MTRNWKVNEELVVGKMKNGIYLIVQESDFKGKNLLSMKENERILHEIMRKIVKPGDTTIDLGGNYGMIAFTLAQIVGKEGKVHVFEASPPVYKILKTTMALNNFTQVETHNLAIMDKPGEIHMEIDPHWSGTTKVSANATTGVVVEGVTLDAFFER
jgi:FkbM family methyltransferase